MLIQTSDFSELTYPNLHHGLLGGVAGLYRVLKSIVLLPVTFRWRDTL
jgi:hypothetical protein